jgi:hypothetical protein
MSTTFWSINLKGENLGRRFMRIVIIIIYFNCKWVFTLWQWLYNKTQHINITHHTK